ncbi:MAG: PBSX family phage terminase large subunit [Oscillospiraceae bacterium]
MELKQFSEKQATAILWWKEPEFRNYEAIICDGAVRSGKTLSMSIGFVCWAMAMFCGGDFAICGRTISSVKRNVITPMKEAIEPMGFVCDEKISKNYMEIKASGRTNRFYFFGGKDEGSAGLIQGITLSGVFLDEVVLMPRSFVEQALARCSVANSRLWFNCNPQNPYHWFYSEWIKKAKEKNALYIHFTMKDNPSLTKKILNRYENLYSGVFYDRFVLGKWIAAEGLVYPMFDEDIHTFSGEIPSCERYIISCDYGTVNPSSFGLWGILDGKSYRIKEYYYSSREKGSLRTDEEHYDGLEKLAEGFEIESVIVDPSAASFMECIRRHGKFCVRPAKNDVISGIRRVCDLLKQGKLLFSKNCKDSLREFQLYVWDDRGGNDAPIKENDHSMDDIRYFVNTAVAKEKDDFFVVSLPR